MLSALKCCGHCRIFLFWVLGLAQIIKCSFEGMSMATLVQFSRYLKMNMHKRLFSISSSLNGQKAKRRKQAMKANMPHIPIKTNSSLPTNIALGHFDQFYSSVFKEARWGSMRLGLLSKQKYAVIVNNFGDSEDTVAHLESMGCVDINREFHLAQDNQEPYVR